MPDIVVSTRNQGKFSEICAIFDEFATTGSHPALMEPIHLLSLKDFTQIGEIPENGQTFEENALIKARAVEQFTGNIALADDSGIAVDTLGGSPGVLSARFAGPGATDEQNNAKLLKELSGVPAERRGATFICVIAVVCGGIELLVRGECRGIILEEGRGSLGFGYDPLFYYPPASKTYSEMTPEEKNRISHRGKALMKLKKELAAFLEKVGA